MKVHVQEDIFMPPELHDKCNQEELGTKDEFKCDLIHGFLTCKTHSYSTGCFKCDCNVYDHGCVSLSLLTYKIII